MKITNDQMAALLISGKKKRIGEKIKDGTLTLDDCGLDAEKNFLQKEETVLIDSEDELERYCEFLCARTPYIPCAMFLVGNEHEMTAVVQFEFEDFDTFKLDGWYCWNLISLVDDLKLLGYGVLCEINRGEWKTIVS